MTHAREHQPRREDERAFMERYAYRFLLGLAALILAIGTVVYRVLEGWSWVDSFYFSSIAVTTVGFGDLAPTRDVSKLFTVAYVFSGIGIITAFINVRLKRHRGALADRAQRSA